MRWAVLPPAIIWCAGGRAKTSAGWAAAVSEPPTWAGSSVGADFCAGRTAGLCAHAAGAVRSRLFVDERLWGVGFGAADFDCAPQKYPGRNTQAHDRAKTQERQAGGSPATMNAEQTLRFKMASGESEFEQIFRLNYKTFVEEIPQHPPNPEKRLVDRFHHENTYLIALDCDQLIGMMAVRDKRPFSLDEKLGNIDRYLPPGRKICEVRLLAVLPSHRNGLGLQRALKLLVEY